MSGSYVWDALPISVRSGNSLSTFKIHFETHLTPGLWLSRVTSIGSFIFFYFIVLLLLFLIVDYFTVKHFGWL